MGIIYKNGIPYGNQPSIDATLTHQGEAADAKAVGDAVSELRNTLGHKADVIYDTASGAIASFPDGADGLPVKDLTVAIEPVQSGTGDPSPTNVRPISGWTGCNVTRTGFNVWDEEWEVGRYNTTTGDKESGNNVRSKNSIQIFPNTQYFIKCPSGFVMTLLCYDTDNNYMSIIYASNEIITTPTNANYMTFMMAGGYGTTYNHDICINFSDPAKNRTYEPGHVVTIPISWQSSAGTVYAASLDTLVGSLKVRPYYESYNGETLVGPWISSMDAYTPGGTPTTGAQVVDLGGVETEYTIDPVTISTLLGQNNIWADCGPSTVEYQADTKLYIQKINTPTDDDMIADANIASGKYFIVNNNLYLSTAAILAGDPIKPGTNCTLTNLAAALNALNS